MGCSVDDGEYGKGRVHRELRDSLEGETFRERLRFQSVLGMEYVGGERVSSGVDDKILSMCRSGALLGLDIHGVECV